jgi:hypothetical protein
LEDICTEKTIIKISSNHLFMEPTKPTTHSTAAPAAHPAHARRHTAPQRDRGPIHRGGGSNSRKPQRHQGNRGGMRRPMNPTHTTKNDQAMIIPPIGDNIRIIPLGGMEEIGRNMSAVVYKDEIIVIDAGIQFSTDETPGVDYILPNTKFLEDNKEKIVALVITHGHLDHIGAIPFLIDRIGNPPIYTREFGALLIKKRQVEFPHLAPLNIKIVEKDDGALPVGKHLKVRFFGLTHAIPDSTGVIIETPFGDIVATGDVRVDNIENIPTQKELDQYSIFKGRNVLMLMMDSTGIDKPGWCISEDIIIRNIDKIVAEPTGGAHRDYDAMMVSMRKALTESLKTFDGMKVDTLLERRHERLMSYGKFKEIEAKP